LPKENVLPSLVIIVPSPCLLSAPHPFVMDGLMICCIVLKVKV